MKKIASLLLFCTLIFSVTGCASMFSSKMTNIPVKTTPESATISLYAYSGGKIFEGKTPCVISLDKKEVLDGRVIISQKGYKEVQVILGRTIEPWGIANGCFFILPGFVIGGGIDYLNGNLIKPEIETINIILEPETNKTVIKGTDDRNLLLSQNLSVSIQKSGSEYMLFIGK